MDRWIVGMLLALELALAGALAGCSTIIEGTTQDIVLNTNPPGANCKLSSGGQLIATVKSTPATITVPRTKNDILIACDKDGYLQTTYLDHSGIDWWTASNGFLTVVGAAGWGTDSYFGADNKYESPVTINLETPPVRLPGMAAADGMNIAPPGAVSGNDMGLRDDRNIIVRFQTLRVLLDEGLITRDEYLKRRGANLGALLRYTAPPGARDLARPAPPSQALVARLHFLAQAFAEHSISANEQSVERTIILEMLMPESVANHADPPPPLTDRLQAAVAIGRLERLSTAAVITEEEKAREKAAILALTDTYIANAEAAARVAAGLVDLPQKPAALPGPWIKLASYSSEAAAMRAWAGLQKAYPNELGSLGASTTTVTRSLHRPTYSLSAGPTADLVAATELCRVLRGHGVSCQPIAVPKAK